MSLERPDLSQVDPVVAAYIEALEAELLALRPQARPATNDGVEPPVAASEPETTMNVITISRDGVAKRTPRHHYGRQNRGGMGVFDLQTTAEDPPSILAVADAGDNLLLFTNLGRAFRLPVADLSETAVRARGGSLTDQVSLLEGERPVAALPAGGDGTASYISLVSERGWVRRIRSSYLGPKMIPATTFHNVKEGGELAAAAWTPADGDLFIATRQGQAIRFNAAQVPTRGCLGLRVKPGDAVVAVAGVYEDSGVFMLGGDGKGTIRLMGGFRANKAPGAGGKVAMKADRLVGAVTVGDSDDIFIISGTSKVIRFGAAHVPPKEGVVQGVNCIALRGDEVAAMTMCKVNSKKEDDESHKQ